MTEKESIPDLQLSGNQGIDGEKVVVISVREFLIRNDCPPLPVDLKEMYEMYKDKLAALTVNELEQLTINEWSTSYDIAKQAVMKNNLITQLSGFVLNLNKDLGSTELNIQRLTALFGLECIRRASTNDGGIILKDTTMANRVDTGDDDRFKNIFRKGLVPGFETFGSILFPQSQDDTTTTYNESFKMEKNDRARLFAGTILMDYLQHCCEIEHFRNQGDGTYRVDDEEITIAEFSKRSVWKNMNGAALRCWINMNDKVDMDEEEKAVFKKILNVDSRRKTNTII